ncbi:MAG: tRNA guanosine(34) transglycosylase Tgt [Pseudomonadota bacterium]|nr:tRNA guanosine(34) transglycosylase Tgt [Pseudomonadota bacterium]QKK05927.1 MAG: tRNA guanosine(34) transglycosylase Tgt [Pseudomonadota bacterium]
MSFAFEITHQAPDSHARLGVLTTPHGAIETPNFIFCGTKASIKGLTPTQMRDCQTDIILSNTYHLMIQPGAELIEKMGGLHKFMGWDGPMLTDSGGFQIFSLGHGSVADEIKGRGLQKRNKSVLKITEEGAEFRSYLDGRKIFLTPEKSIDIQRKLGADLIVQLDECTPFHVDKDYTARSMAMSMRWGDRSLAEWKRKDDGRQVMYGIVQGGIYPDLRKECCEWLQNSDFFGTAVGGSLGSHKEQMYEVVSYCTPHLPEGRPVHLLGIGGFRDIFEGVKLGMDTFDCVSPTRLARHGWALKKGAEKERINVRNARFKEDAGPVDENCACPCCQSYSLSYLNHLFRAGEMLGMQLLSLHNVFTMNRLMRELRTALANDSLQIVEKEWCVS